MESGFFYEEKEGIRVWLWYSGLGKVYKSRLEQSVHSGRDSPENVAAELIPHKQWQVHQ